MLIRVLIMMFLSAFLSAYFNDLKYYKKCFKNLKICQKSFQETPKMTISRLNVNKHQKVLNLS